MEGCCFLALPSLSLVFTYRQAWIEVEKSAFLMGKPQLSPLLCRCSISTGVADETDSLNEGEIFCQIHPPYQDPQIITGPCTIYRNPCCKSDRILRRASTELCCVVHPGDVRLVQAVDCPSLRHLRNVIVFNTRGHRDLPNM